MATSSKKLAAANRRNARRSTGPRTAKGKGASARNALKHGILSRSPVIEGVESEAEWREHLDATVAAFEPEGYLELVRRIALQTWRLERLRRYETALSSERVVGIARRRGRVADCPSCRTASRGSRARIRTPSEVPDPRRT